MMVKAFRSDRKHRNRDAGIVAQRRDKATISSEIMGSIPPIFEAPIQGLA
jgi:hypothetical protein